MKNKLAIFGSVFFALLFLAVIVPQVNAQSPADLLYLGNLSATRFLPASINAGDTISMAVDIQNKGAAVSMDNVVASIDVGNNFSPVTPSDRVDSIAAGSTNTFVLKFKANDNLSPGIYQVTLTLSYLREGQDVNQSFVIPVPVSTGQKNISLAVNPTVINPGNQTVMDFSIANLGANPISNVTLTWVEKSGLILPLGSDNHKFVSSINPGEKVDFNYTVAADPNISTGIYSLGVSLSYTDASGIETQASQVGIIVGGGTDFDVSSDYSGGQLSFSIANVGSNNAGAVVVKLANQTGFTISGSDTVVIGTLNKGDYSLANFTVQSGFDANAAGGIRRGAAGAQSNSSGSAGNVVAGAVSTTGSQQNASQSTGAGAVSAARSAPANYVVDIYYTDTTGERQHVQKSFALSARTSGSGFAAGGAAGGAGQNGDLVTIAIAFAVIVAAGAVYNKYRAKRNWKDFAIIAAVGIVVPVVILLLAPRTISTTALAAVFLAAAVVLFFVMRKK